MGRRLSPLTLCRPRPGLRRLEQTYITGCTREWTRTVVLNLTIICTAHLARRASEAQPKPEVEARLRDHLLRGEQ